MKRLTTALALSALIAGAGPAVANETTPVAKAAPTAETAPPPTAAPQGKPKLVCRDAEITGSRMSRKRICKTAAQWRKEAQPGSGGRSVPAPSPPKDN